MASQTAFSFVKFCEIRLRLDKTPVNFWHCPNQHLQLKKAVLYYVFSFSLSYFIPQKWHVYFFFFLHLVVYICTGYAPDSWIARELYTILISLSLHYLLTTTMTSYLCMISFPAPTVCLLICRQGQYMISHDLTWSQMISHDLTVIFLYRVHTE